MPAIANALAAAAATVPRAPARPPLRAMPSSRTGSTSQRAARSGVVTTSAAAPSVIGAHIGSVSMPAMRRASSTSATVNVRWCCAFGFSAPCAWFLTATRAKSSAVAPLRSAYSRAKRA